MLNILYVEGNTDGTIGGSYYSLLFLTQQLDKNIYSPIVIFYSENELVNKFKEAGCKVIILNKTKSISANACLSVLEVKLKFPILLSVIKPISIVAQKIVNFFITFIFPSSECWKILMKEKIDLVHLNNTLLRPQEWIFASLFTKAKVVAHERGINNQFPAQYRFWAGYLKAILCISEAVRNNLRHHGFPEKKLHLIYNGIDPDIFSPSKDKEVILRKLGVDEDSQLIGLVGNIKQWKGQDVAVKAMEIVKEKFPKSKCLLIGGYSPSSKDYYDYVRDLVETEGLINNIVFTGHQRDVPSMVNVLKILIHTSVLPEPFGRVLLEGMALRKPIITNSIGAGPEIVEDGETGLVVKPANPEDLARAIIYLFDNPQKSEQLGLAGRKRLEKHFHINETARKTVKIYSELLKY